MSSSRCIVELLVTCGSCFTPLPLTAAQAQLEGSETEISDLAEEAGLLETGGKHEEVASERRRGGPEHVDVVPLLFRGGRRKPYEQVVHVIELLLAEERFDF